MILIMEYVYSLLLMKKSVTTGSGFSHCQEETAKQIMDPFCIIPKKDAVYCKKGHSFVQEKVTNRSKFHGNDFINS